jgi:CRISPR system Cascade subunit CasD
MDNKYLLLWLEAPMQSWGADSKFGRRDSLPFPTKSGVVGILLCALGASGPQTELLEELSSLKQTVISYARLRKGKDSSPCKVDREPLLRDFQMVGSGYKDENPWESLLIPKTSEGKKAVGGGTKMTYRYYLQDAKFAVVMEVPTSRSIEFAEALQHPVYDLYLGRKNCVPTDFVFRGIFESQEAALQNAEKVAQEKCLLIEDFSVVDGEDAEGDSMTLNDVPVQFGEIKRYRDRRVTVITK